MTHGFSKLDIINVRFSNSGEGLGKNYQDLHLSSFKTPIHGRVLSEESAPLCASSMRKCVIDNFLEKLGKKRCDYSDF